jgi:hypothetical protein
VDYTGLATQQSKLRDLGRLVTPGHLGMVYTGLPWTTLSLGDYGLSDQVTIPHLINYVAAPSETYWARPGRREFRVGSLIEAGPGSAQTAVGDIDMDGRMDLLVTASTTGELIILKGMGDGSFTPMITHTLASGQPGKMAIADFDDDGNPDVAMVDLANPEVHFILDPSSSSATTSTFTVASSTMGIRAGDLNGDGAIDLIVSTVSGHIQPVMNSEVTPGTFTAGATYEANSSAVQSPDVALADLNGDGILDAAAVNNKAGTDVAVFLGHGDGTFTLNNALMPAGITGAREFVGIEATDLDGDGDQDLVTCTGDPKAICTFTNSGDASAWTARVEDVGNATLDMAVADFNLDGAPDVAFTLGLDSVGVLFNQGDGTFDNSVEHYGKYTTADQATGLAAADVDADGVADIAVGLANLNSVAVLHNLGDSPRLFGRVNVNTASEAVLAAVFKQDLLSGGANDIVGQTAAQLATAVRDERESVRGPFRSLDDFFDRMSADLVVALDHQGNGGGQAYTGASEALARFMCNMVDTRSDLYGVQARVRLYRDVDGNEQRDANEDILSDRTVHMIIDRSQQPARVLLKRYLYDY